jgi:hypothetical protein
VTNTSPCWYGDIVPGSTLMYGSNFWSPTLRPRATRRRPIEAAAMPLPSDETTPPVMNTYRVSGTIWVSRVRIGHPGPGRVPAPEHREGR